MLDPKDLAIKANDLRKQKEYTEALKLYKQSWDNLKDAYTGAGLLHCLRKLEKVENAVTFAEVLINLFPTIDWVKNEVAWTLISFTFKNKKNFIDALDYAEKIEKITNNTIILKQIAFHLVKLADNNDRLQVGINWLKKVNPEDLSNNSIKGTKWSDKSQWKYNFYKVLFEIGHYDDLIDHIDESIEQFPHIKEFFLNLKAKALRNLGKYIKSSEIYEALLKYKTDWWIYRDYADLLIKMDKKEKALMMLYQAVSKNLSKKMMVNEYFRIGKLCIKLGKEQDALYHFMLCKLIRENEDWTVPEDLLDSIEKLATIFPDISNLKSIKPIFSCCQGIWEKVGIIKTKNQKKKKLRSETFKGILKLGPEGRPFCFINTKSESIICDKSILPSNIKDNDSIKCEAIPSYDKKKQKNSWKAIKVEKI